MSSIWILWQESKVRNHSAEELTPNHLSQLSPNDVQNKWEQRNHSPNMFAWVQCDPSFFSWNPFTPFPWIFDYCFKTFVVITMALWVPTAFWTRDGTVIRLFSILLGQHTQLKVHKWIQIETVSDLFRARITRKISFHFDTLVMSLVPCMGCESVKVSWLANHRQLINGNHLNGIGELPCGAKNQLMERKSIKAKCFNVDAEPSW